MKILSLVLICFLFIFSISGSETRIRQSFRKKLPPVLIVEPNNLDDSTASLSSAEQSSSPGYKVNNQIDGIIRRFEIYIRHYDTSALFCELGSNPEAATLYVFEGIFETLNEIIQSRNFLKDGTINPVELVASVFRAFIHFNVDVTQVILFKTRPKQLDFFTSRFKTLKRPFLAFLVLLQDRNGLLEASFSNNPNFYALHNAILLLPNIEAQIETYKLFHEYFGIDSLTSPHNIPKRLFRDSSDTRLCLFLISKGFDPLKYPNIFSQSKFPISPTKWDFFSEIYGHQVVDEFLQSGSMIKPQQTEEALLPFVAYPLHDMEHPRWTVYEAAFGCNFIKYQKRKLIKKI